MSDTKEPFRILVAEDSITQAFVLKRLLSEHGFEVTLASNGEEALSALEKGKFDLVLSDIEMPGVSGYELSSRVKSHPEWNKVPLILLSNLSQAEDILNGLAAHADFYLTKPYTPKQLVERLRTVLAEWERPTDEERLQPLEITFRGKRHLVTAGRRQMLTLLLSTYENAVERNWELVRTQLELSQRNEQLRQANETLEAVAREDALTGLKNVRALRERLNEEIQRAERYKLALSIILLDVDRFKEFNDSFGHPAGDLVLKELARCIRLQCRNTDFPARSGGEEFLVVLPNTTETEAVELAERIRRAVEQCTWRLRPVTASFGVAEFNSQNSTAELLVNAADQALYRSKRSGRNRVTASTKPNAS